MENFEEALELPTKRQSRNFNEPEVDIYDPNYIPLLNKEANYKVDYSRPAFSALPSLPTLHKDGASVLLKRSNSGTAPETVKLARGIVTQDLPSRTPTGSKQRSPIEIGSSCTGTTDESRITSPALSASEPSATCTVSSLEEHVYTIPGNIAPKAEDLQMPAIPPSARSSMSSTIRTVPTSRYNKNSLASISNNSTASLPWRSATPLPSQDERLEPARNQSHHTGRSTPIPPAKETPPARAYETGRSTPLLPPPEIPQDIRRKPLNPTKSTASERRARALHSHPSNQSIKSNQNAMADDMPSHPEAEKPRSVSRIKTRSIVNSRQSSPAPDTPLPDLPPQIRHAPAIEKTTARRPQRTRTSSATSSLPATLVQNDHTELTEFMTSKKSTLFRRFDDVHVRLLLHLQDEIATLEKELLKLENEDSGRHETIVAKTKVMTELRRAIAEYDSLFATWNAMQANKASDEMKTQLTRWLQESSTSGSISRGAREDLSWIQTSKDLSSVTIDPEKNFSETHLADGNGKLSVGSSSGGGILAWFGCASKRK